jgi:hypothetical protein
MLGLAADMRLARETSPKPPAAAPAESGCEKLNITVVFTSVRATLAALRKAASLADGLGARVTLRVLQVVPFPLPLDEPPLAEEWNARRFRTMAAECPVETLVRVYFCRDRVETLCRALEARSLVVIGSERRSWWFGAGRTLARALRRAGHDVVFAAEE